MVRKRSDLPDEVFGSNQPSIGSESTQHPPPQVLQPQHQGGYQVWGGRGYRGPPRGGYRGRMPQHYDNQQQGRYQGGPPRGGYDGRMPQHYEYQQQGRGRQQYQQGCGGYVGGCVKSPAGGGTPRTHAPDLPQAKQSPYSAANPPYVSTDVGGPSSSTFQPSDPSQVAEQMQQLSVQPEVAPVQEMTPTSSKPVRFPLRPGQGSYGTKCFVKANHFVAELPDKDLHQYDVSITPDFLSRDVNRAVMEQFVKIYRESHLGNRLPACDGRKNLYTAGPLPFLSSKFKITLIEEEDGTGGPRREKDYNVVIKYAARADLHHLGMYLQARQADAPQEALQILDIVLRELPTSSLILQTLDDLANI